MKKKKNYPKPLSALENLTYNFSDIWKKVVPSDFGSSQRFCEDVGIKESVYIIYALSKWRLSKQIFEIDPELCAILMDTDRINEELPNEVINRLIYDCFYVALPQHYITITSPKNENGELGKFEIDGFFYYTVGKSVIFVLLFTSGHTQSMGFDVYDGASLKECIDRHLKVSPDVYKVLDFFVQVVLYLCADNADIRENAIQKEIYKPPAQNKPEDVKDKYSELRKWDVGFRYGKAIRKVKQQKKAENQPDEQSEVPSEHRKGSNARKRTHVRRGHYHHFWRGSEQDGTRELVLKWLSPVVINSEYENIVTIRKVKP